MLFYIIKTLSQRCYKLRLKLTNLFLSTFYIKAGRLASVLAGSIINFVNFKIKKQPVELFFVLAG
jgi:hypothetical protein